MNWFIKELSERFFELQIQRNRGSAGHPFQNGKSSVDYNDAGNLEHDDTYYYEYNGYNS